MFRRTMVALSIMVPILAIGAGVAISQREKETKSPADLTGEWRLDPSRSGFGPGMGARGGWTGRDGPQPGGPREGRMRAGGGPETDERAGRARMVRLPERIRIEQAAGLVSIADSTGVTLERIMTGKTEARAEEVPSVAGEWNKGSLQVVREGRRGRVTQTFSLEDEGRTLVIQTKTESNGPRPSREFKRVYRRMST